MNVKAEKLIQKYLDFSGDRTASEFKEFIGQLNSLKLQRGDAYYDKITYMQRQLIKGYFVAMGEPSKKISVIIEEDSLDFLDEENDLGKLVDEGEVPRKGRADKYWDGHISLIFNPGNKSVRDGSALPRSYKLTDERFLIGYYDLKAIEFGNWLNEEDRSNYLAGLALALFDLKNILHFSQEQIGLHGLLSVAFGARGSGRALAHFEPWTWAINLTRYKRPPKISKRGSSFDKKAWMLASGGVGSFCHEFGHALDYFCGTFIEKSPEQAFSHGRSTRTKPDRDLLRRNSLQGAMERLLFRIIWDKNGQRHSDYYKRLEKSQSTEYWFRRNEIFARAFEVYIQYKLKKRESRNVFLTFNKYFRHEGAYLSYAEMKRLERDFDDLISMMRRKITPRSHSHPEKKCTAPGKISFYW